LVTNNQQIKAEEAFSRQSSIFDALEDGNKILQWMRVRVRNHLLSQLKPGSRILELNAGTGLDAVYLAEHGFKVHATDVSDGMVMQLEQKVKSQNIANAFTIQKCSYTELYKIEQEPFDYIFSNFGGLNCIPDLGAVTKQFPGLLKPGGKVTFVLMPAICPWEILLAFKGNFKTAFRRLKKGGTPSNIEGLYFDSFYFTPKTAIKSFGRNFKKIKLEGLASISPPPYLDWFPDRLPRIYKVLTNIDTALCTTWPFNSWADHFILTMQYMP